jgi:hypothetical protein
MKPPIAGPMIQPRLAAERHVAPDEGGRREVCGQRSVDDSV